MKRKRVSFWITASRHPHGDTSGRLKMEISNCKQPLVSRGFPLIVPQKFDNCPLNSLHWLGGGGGGIFFFFNVRTKNGLILLERQLP